MDTELVSLADKLAVQINAGGKKKVTVIDFTDLQGGTSELGKYVAEQLTVNLVMAKRDFAVLDRANLRRILAEHKLTSQGLVDPENAKKLGQFAGVDALILGTIIPKSQTVNLTAKIITTDTAEIVGAAKAEFREDASVKQLLSQAAPESRSAGGMGGSEDEKARAVKSFGDLRVEVQSLRVIAGGQYLLTMSLENKNQKKSVWVALDSHNNMNVKGSLTDSGGFQFVADWTGVSGISLSSIQRYGYQPGGFSPSTEVGPNDAVTATLKFKPFDGSRRAAPGVCNLQIELLVGQDLNGASPTAKAQNLVAKVEAQ